MILKTSMSFMQLWIAAKVI